MRMVKTDGASQFHAADKNFGKPENIMRIKLKKSITSDLNYFDRSRKWM